MHKNIKGFSLVELSIVLVILGLLTGGILAGQSLIRAAELRAVSTEHQRWVTATHSFRDKYLAFPGDMTNATAFWGKDNTKCSGDTGTTATPGTCNGDGDGNIELGAATTGATGEIFRYWQQLALAGLIEGTYTGINTGDADTVTIASNIPPSKITAAGWTIAYNEPLSTAFFTVTQTQNIFFYGLPAGNDLTSVAVLKPEELWNIDTKMDDGKPGRGKVIAGRITTCTNSASATDFDTTYKLDSTNTACSIMFPSPF